MSDYLTPEELIELTDAKTRPAQQRWLQANGMRFVVSTKGRVKVLRAQRDAVMGMGKVVRIVPAPEPDFTVFGKAA